MQGDMPDWLITLPVKLPSSEPIFDTLAVRCISNSIGSLNVSEAASSSEWGASDRALVVASWVPGGCITPVVVAEFLGRGTMHGLAMPGACTSIISAMYGNITTVKIHGLSGECWQNESATSECTASCSRTGYDEG